MNAKCENCIYFIPVTDEGGICIEKSISRKTYNDKDEVCEFYLGDVKNG